MEILIKNLRLGFPNIFHPKAMPGSDVRKYSATFLFEPGSDAYKAVEAVQKQVAKEKWGEKADKVMKGLETTPDKLVLKNGDTKAEYEGFEGMFFVNASNKVRPVIVDRDRSELGESDGRPYAGCYVNAILDVWAQDNDFGKRINASLKKIQFVRDGDAFSGGGGVSTQNDFDNIADGANSDDLE